ncbi:APC family permease [Pseudolysinimonas sp.]|uniref:APC family permease n=1 Tax=Pseudolysinimonas sp. TaxID=2680009 RepID=UPI003F81DC68
MTQATRADLIERPSTDKGLRPGAVGLVSSIVVGVASTAPAYSLAAALGFIVVSGVGSQVVGVHAPGVVLLAFVPMYFIAVAYQQLNKAEPDCGTTFTWASRAFGPILGWVGGWGIIVADVIVMANLAQIAGQTTFGLLGNLGDLVGYTPMAKFFGEIAVNYWWELAAGIVWIALMTWICYRGIEVSARLQRILLSIEVVILVVFAVFALVKVYTGHGAATSILPQWDWFNPFALNFGSVLAPGLLAAIFIYWGWDSAVSINEETSEPAKTPGRAAIISTVLLLLTYTVVTTASVSYAGIGDKGIGLANPDNSDNVFLSLGPSLFGDSVIGHILMTLLTISILTSASASTQTTILPTARTTLSMAVYKAVPERFARIHPRFLTPTWSTVGMGIASVGFYALVTFISNDLLTPLIDSIGLMIAFYYGLTGFACVWFYRRTFRRSTKNFIQQFLFPLLGGLMLAYAFVYGLITYAEADWEVDSKGHNLAVNLFGWVVGDDAVFGVGGILIGFVLMFIWWAIRPDFFRGKTLPRQSADLVLAADGSRIAGFGLPDSGYQATLIAPDRSNLPPGEEAVPADQEELPPR